jgi:peroxiredoxin
VDQLDNGDIKQVAIRDLFAGKKGVLFGVPGEPAACALAHMHDYTTRQPAASEPLAHLQH